jgi:hypothetical protein
MIKIEVNNQQSLEVTQNNHIINVERWSQTGIKTDNYQISEGDFVMLLNYYRFQKENGKEIFE